MRFYLFKMVKIRGCLHADGNNLIESKNLLQHDRLEVCLSYTSEHENRFAIVLISHSIMFF